MLNGVDGEQFVLAAEGEVVIIAVADREEQLSSRANAGLLRRRADGEWSLPSVAEREGQLLGRGDGEGSLLRGANMEG